jgi:membrane protein implicated in regulation of membrane protease activity
MNTPEVKKDTRTGAIVGTVLAILLCGLPGLCLLCPISVFILAGGANNYDWNYITPSYGAIPLCLAVVFILIAVLVPVLTLRKKKPSTPEVIAAEALPPQPPIPPADNNPPQEPPLPPTS